MVGRKHDKKQRQYRKRDPELFLVEIQQRFEPTSDDDWYSGGELRRLVLDYYLVLRSVLRDKPRVRGLLSRCRHCGIFFIADPRNVGRQDLGCPFGCAELHRSRRSKERSVAYNRSPIGKLKRHQREEERRLAADRPAGGAVAAKPQLEFAARMVTYIRMVISLLEGRRIHREEILETLARTRRQHSFAREKRIDYVLRRLREEPEKPP